MNKEPTLKGSQTDREALEKMEDEEIDLSEIPEVTAEQIAQATLRFGGQPVSRGKVRVNIYLDAEVVEYFKAEAGGRGYQTFIPESLFSEEIRMLTQKKVKALLRDKYPYLVTEYGVKRIGLFGSYAKGKPHEESDIDLVVEFDQPLGFRFIEFTEYLEQLLGKKVEVLTPAGIQGIRIAHIAKDIEDSIVYV